MFRILPVYILIFMVAMLIHGCASTSRSSEYETVREAPNRDTEAAKKTNVKATMLMEQGKYAEAEKMFKKSLAADITYGIAHNNLGKTYFYQGKYYLAAWEFQYAIKLMEHHPEPRNNLGLVLEEVGRLNEAVDAYTQAVDLGPDNPVIIGNLARARIRRGDRDEQVCELLQDLVMRDTRPQWVAWAREKLALMCGNKLNATP